MAPVSDLGRSFIYQLKEVFDGNPWYGESLMSKLKLIRQEADNPEALNKTASYVKHLVNWRQFVIKKLQGDAEFDIALNTDADWTNQDLIEFSAWDLLIEKLGDTQQLLIQLIGQQTDDSMKLQVPGKDYTYEFMIHGLIQHEVYHTGQIAVYWKNR